MDCARALVFALALAGAACASGGGVKAPAAAEGPACKVFPGQDVEVAKVDGKKAKIVKNYFAAGKDYAKIAAGKRAVTFQRHRKKLVLSFSCKAGRSYHLIVGEVPGDIYGAKTIWAVEEAGTRRIVASGSP